MTKTRSECIVFVYLPGETEAVPCGRLTIIQAGRDVSSTFSYGNLYRTRPNAISLDPVELPLSSVESEILRPLSGNVLFGCLRDAAPDAWGRLAINDKWAHKHKANGKIQAPNTFDLPEMEYLLRSRNDRVGVIDFREFVTDAEPSKRVSGILHLKDLVKESTRIARHEPAKTDVLTLFHPGTGMGGARPKTSIEDEEGLWLAKFPMDSDKLPITRIEHAMLKLAQLCGITTVESKLLPMETGEPVFMIKRFDRVASDPKAKAKERSYFRTSYLSALTAMGKDEFNQSSSSYQEIGQFIQRRDNAGSQSDSRKELFRRMVFNIIVNNDDDHLRNHGFLRNSNSTYSPAPIFDIVPRSIAPGMGTQRRQAIGVGNFGREGTVENILSDLDAFDLDRDEAIEILVDVSSVIHESWSDSMKEAGISESVIESFENVMLMAHDILIEFDALDVEVCKVVCERN